MNLIYIKYVQILNLNSKLNNDKNNITNNKIELNNNTINIKLINI